MVRNNEAWIFDVDGTLSDPSHRRSYVTGGNKRWDLWNSTMGDDAFNLDVAKFMVVGRNLGKDILVCTGREDSYREVTEMWFAALHAVMGHDCYYDKMYMRKAKDYRSDNIVKKEMLDQIREEGYNPVLVFDDRDSVVKMWRENGLRCFQVNEGAF